jgi:hypothetical protein
MTSPIVTEFQSDSSTATDTSEYPRVILEDYPNITTNSTTIKASTAGSIKRSRGCPRKFSKITNSTSDRRSYTESSHIIGKSTSASEAYYSGTSDWFSQSGSAVYSDDDIDIPSSEDDSHSEEVMVILFFLLFFSKILRNSNNIYPK